MCNILYLSPSSSLWGARKSLLILLDNLNKKKYTPVVVCPHEGALIKELRSRNIKTKFIRFRGWRKLRNAFFIPSIIFSLTRLIKEERISLIHCNEFWLNPYAVFAAKITHIPCITHIRTPINEAKIRQYLFSWTNKIVTVSDSIAKPFHEFPKIKNRVKTIYNGVDVKEFNPNIKAKQIKVELNLLKENWVVGTVGQLYSDKGQKTFLEAAKIVLLKNKKVRFLIIGEAKKEKSKLDLQKTVKDLDINSYVIFTGFRKDIPQILSSMDVFVLPSLKEGFSRSIIEAMAVGKPVITTPAGGNSEAVVDRVTGFLVPFNNSGILAEKILELLNDKKRMQKMGEEGRKRVEDNFTVEHYVKGIEEIYSKYLINN